MPRALEAKPIDGTVQEEQRPEAELGEIPGYKYKVEECEPESEKGRCTERRKFKRVWCSSIKRECFQKKEGVKCSQTVTKTAKVAR